MDGGREGTDMARTGSIPASRGGASEGRRCLREAAAAAARWIAMFRPEQTWIVSSAVAVATGLVVLAGWFAGVERVTYIFAGAVSMKANTAASIILLGIGLALLAPRNQARGWQAAGLACAGLAAAIGVATLAEHVLGWDLRIDQLLVNDVPNAPGTSAPGRMASFSAASFALLGVALGLLRFRKERLAQATALAAGLLGLVALAGYVYDARELSGFGRQTQMAVHTSLSVLLLSGGVVSARPTGMMESLMSPGPGGVAARRLLPAAIAVPLLLGWLRLVGERRGLYDTEQGLALFATSNIAIFVALIWQTSRSLNAADERRSVAEQEVRALNEELEERVSERTTELEAANHEMEAFSYSISHDLRAPLRAIDGFSRILEDEYSAELDAEATRLLGVVRSSVRQMGRLVDDLLEFSRLSRQPVSRRRVNPALIVAEAIEALGVPPERREQIVIGNLPTCSADAALLKQVFVNLISNALKFSAGCEQPRIEVGSEVVGGQPVCFVRDNGVGFNMRYADKLFVVFQRLHPSDQYEGTGVGLAIVQRIVQRHGGRVWAEGRVNQGATFYFTMEGPKAEM